MTTLRIVASSHGTPVAEAQCPVEPNGVIDMTPLMAKLPPGGKWDLRLVDGQLAGLIEPRFVAAWEE